MTRHLFETTLAVAFLLRHRITLRAHGTPLAQVPNRPLTTRFRAEMYIANVAFEKDRTRREFERTPRVKRHATRAGVATVAADVAAAEAILGPEWTRRLKAARSYSGLSIRDLALSLGLAPAYATAYRRGSWAVHPVHLTRYIEPNDTGGQPTVYLAPATDDVETALRTANVLLRACVEFLNDRFGFGLETGIKEHGVHLGILVK